MISIKETTPKIIESALFNMVIIRLPLKKLT